VTRSRLSDDPASAETIRQFRRYPTLTELSIPQVADELGVRYVWLQRFIARLGERLPRQYRGRKQGKRVFDWRGVEAIREALQEEGKPLARSAEAKRGSEEESAP
jgi:hypothetical protein